MTSQTKEQMTERRKLAVLLIELAEKAYGQVKRDTRVNPLEEMLLLILAEGSTMERAVKAFQEFSTEFVDLNELRVSPAGQIAEVIFGVTQEQRKAELIKRFLDKIFAQHHFIRLDFLAEMTAAGARSYIEGIEDMPPRVVANLMMRHFGETKMPADESILRVVQRVKLIEDIDLDKAEETLGEIVNKRQAFTFHELMERVAADTCLVSVRHCGRCPLSSVCAGAAQAKNGAKSKKLRKPGTARTRNSNGTKSRPRGKAKAGKNREGKG